MIILKVKKLAKDARLPSYAHKGDAGLDFFSLADITFNPGEIKTVPTGVALEIPDGHVGLMWDKSGIAIHEGMKCMGGVFDSGYRGEVLIGMINLSKNKYTFKKGHKVAQMLIQKCEYAKVKERQSLSSSERGEKGRGSTGK